MKKLNLSSTYLSLLELEEHLDIHYEDGDFTCDTCLFQTNKMSLLRNHLQKSSGHLSGQVHGRAAIKCKFCEEKFIVKKDLVAHKNNRHKTYKICDFFIKGNCKRSPCRYSHKKIKEGYCVCYECGKDFNDTSDMYNHRKREQKKELCKKFLNNECDRDEADCWFSHVRSVIKPHQLKVGTTHENKTSNCGTRIQGFQKTPPSPVPPTLALSTEQLMTLIEEKVQKTLELFLSKMTPRA